MTPKEQAIKNAYGAYWDKVKYHVNPRGWCNFKSLFGEAGNSTGKLDGIELEVLNNYHSTHCYFNRPKSLSGIENNNGWNKIEDEGYLPYDVTTCFIMKDGLIFYPMLYRPDLQQFQDVAENNIDWQDVSHWQLFKEPQKPIY